MTENSVFFMRLNAKKKSKYYTKFHHYKKFDKILKKLID